MISLVSNLLVFSAVCLLALPASWCCAPSAEEKESKEIAAETCSACAPHGESAQGDSEPLRVPEGKCNCRGALAPLAVGAKAGLSAISVLPVAFAELPAVPLCKLARAGVRLIDPGPPLRVLQCVMRC